MAQAKQLDGQLAKVKFCCGEQVFNLSINFEVNKHQKGIPGRLRHLLSGGWHRRQDAGQIAPGVLCPYGAIVEECVCLEKVHYTD